MLSNLRLALRRVLPSRCVIIGCDRIALCGLACRPCDAFLRGATGLPGPWWWVLVPALEDAFQAGRAELRATEAAEEENAGGMG